MPKAIKKNQKSPTQRSIEYLEAQGYLVGKVEQQIPHTFIKRDLFGIFDLLAIRDGETVGIQVTSDSHVMDRVHKIEGAPHLYAIRAAGWRILVHGWKSVGNKPREVDLS